MATAWFEVPYELNVREGNRPVRSLALNRWNTELAAADGYWAEAEIDSGDLQKGEYGRAIAKVRAPAGLLTRIGREFTRLDDPTIRWVPERGEPNGGRRVATKQLEVVDFEVLDDTRFASMKARVAAFMLAADRADDGYTRVVGGTWYEEAVILSMLGGKGYGLDRASTGTYPTTGILDNFNRADGALVTGNWSKALGAAADDPQIATNVVKAGAAGTDQSFDIYWNPGVFAADSESYISVPTLDSGAGAYTAVGANVRGKDVGGSGYDTYVSDIETGYCAAARKDNGVDTAMGATFGNTLAAGNKVGAEMLGSTFGIYLYTTAWALLGPRIDTTYQAGGYSGLGMYNHQNNARVDDFGGGSATPTFDIIGEGVIPVPR